VTSRTTQGAAEQVSLPLSIAFRICMQGIRTRLGRSVVTMLGIVLGVAFLMSVLTGGVAKDAVADEAAVRQEIGRRLALLRQQVGRLSDKTVRVIAVYPSETDRRMIETLRDQGAAVVEDGGVDVQATIALGAYGDATIDVPAIAFEAVEDAAPNVQVLALEPSEAERQAAEAAARTARYRLYWLIGASLLITAIGITNAMLMSVTERIREIGTLRCLGALSSFIVRLFLIESALLGVVGAAAGVLVGFILSLLGYGYVYGFGLILGNMSYAALAAAAGACLVAGVFIAMLSGIYPARVAARMIPASALASHV